VISGTFILCQLREITILEVLFLKRNKCHIDFNKPAVMLARQELPCFGKFDRALVEGVQVVQSCTIHQRSQATVCFRVNCKKIFNLRVVEGALRDVQLRNSLNRLEEHGNFLVQCVNTFTEPIELSAGLLVGRFHSVQEQDVGPAMEMVKEACGVPATNGRGPVPEHLIDLHRNACDDCKSNSNSGAIALWVQGCVRLRRP